MNRRGRSAVHPETTDATMTPRLPLLVLTALTAASGCVIVDRDPPPPPPDPYGDITAP